VSDIVLALCESEGYQFLFSQYRGAAIWN